MPIMSAANAMGCMGPVEVERTVSAHCERREARTEDEVGRASSARRSAWFCGGEDRWGKAPRREAWIA